MHQIRDVLRFGAPYLRRYWARLAAGILFGVLFGLSNGSFIWATHTLTSRLSPPAATAGTAERRLDALMAPGGLQDCGNAQNCVAVCPKEIPLTTSIARAGRATTVHWIKSWFDR